jgi:hypothetical protein
VRIPLLWRAGEGHGAGELGLDRSIVAVGARRHVEGPGRAYPRPSVTTNSFVEPKFTQWSPKVLREIARELAAMGYVKMGYVNK